MTQIILFILLSLFSYRVFKNKLSLEDKQSSQTKTPKPGLSKQQALKILGLDNNASQDEIQIAYKRLMNKIHPDKGGSDYLAQEINQAFALLSEKKQ